MKICLSGAQCTGKTSLLNLIEKSGYFTDRALLREIVRTLVAKENIKINTNSHHYSQMMIFNAHSKNIATHEDFVSDRCALDAYAYAAWGFIHDRFTQEENQQHIEFFQECMKHYDVIFYLPANFPLVNDGFRSMDADFREEIDAIFKRLLLSSNVPFFELSGPPEEKFKLMTQILHKKYSFKAPM